MTFSSFRVGIIGSGFQARNLGEAVLSTAGLTLASIAGTTPERVRALATRLSTTAAPSVESLLADETLELIIVATPNGSHAALALRALDTAATVFVEKPLALQESDLDALASRVATEPYRLIVGHALRTAPGIHRMIDEVAMGEIGDVLSIEGLRTRILHPASGPLGWKHDPELSGGELLHEIHELDLICLLGGEVSDAASVAAPAPTGSREPAIRHTLLSFSSGATGHHVVASGDHYARWSLTASGSAASLHADLRAGTITRMVDGMALEEWAVFPEPEINAALVAASSGRAQHNSPGAGASPWMATLAREEMAEVARILAGERTSLLLQAPQRALRVALTIS